VKTPGRLVPDLNLIALPESQNPMEIVKELTPKLNDLAGFENLFFQEDPFHGVIIP
jgi:hypothetical protein